MNPSYSRWPFVLALTVAACNDTPTQPDRTPLFAAARTVTVATTLAEWQNAIANAKKGGQILVQGTIEIPGGEEVFLEVPNVTIGAATPGSGLRGVLNPTGNGPVCLICLGAAADGATVEGLTLEAGILSFPMNAAVSVSEGDPLVGVTFRDNYAICDGCEVHVFFNNAPNATFADNVLMGQPAFSAIQIQQRSTGVRVIDNWVEHGGPFGGIRIRPTADEPLVVDNTIASAPHNGIHMAARGGTFRDNKILAITDEDAFSCIDVTTGTRTAGTANTWIDNQAPVPSSPVGICGPFEPAADISFVGSAPPPGSQVSEAGPFQMTFTVVATRDLAEHSLHVALGAPGSGHPVFTGDDCASVHSAPFSLKARRSLTVTVDFNGDPPRSCTPLPFTTTVVGAALEPCDVDPECHDFGRAAVVRYFNLSYTFVP